MFDELAVLFIDVVDNGIFPVTRKGSEVVPVDIGRRASFPKIRSSLSMHLEAESSEAETMVRSRAELRNNSDISQAKTPIEDDVVYFIMEILELRVTMDGCVDMINSDSLSPCSLHITT
ncbi:unnamed protein product [Haemonchus placei]|uniref:CACTA en-spm transposon protein n=1 Tax=Haemonchus placei TaxID=6290 RepID=A0A0N4WF36_HAEPC|nr:unnamed protein product [Haemonchus placei]